MLASFAGSTDYTAASALANFTIAQVTPSVTVTDSGGTYNGTGFPATATVTGLSGSPASSLEGVTPSLAYYSGTYSSTAQLNGLTSSSTAPSTAGAYTVLASFPGSTDYTAASALANFTITQATPTVTVADPGGPYTGTAFPATAIGRRGQRLGRHQPRRRHAVARLLHRDLHQRLAAHRPDFVVHRADVRSAPTPSWPASPAAPTTPAASALANFTITQATPTVTVTDPSGTYTGTPFPATATVTGVSGSPASSLEGVTPSLAYYTGTYTSAAQLNGLTSSIHRAERVRRLHRPGQLRRQHRLHRRLGTWPTSPSP